MASRRQAKKTMKASEVKTAEKTVETKVEDVKKAVEAKAEEVKKAAEKKTAEVKKATAEKVEEVKKAAEKKTTEKKAAPKKTAKKEIKTEVVLQYGEKEVNTKDMVAAVKKEWTKAKHKVSDIKSMELYVKPEDYAVYYVINGDTTGKIWL